MWSSIVMVTVVPWSSKSASQSVMSIFFKKIFLSQVLVRTLSGHYGDPSCCKSSTRFLCQFEGIPYLVRGERMHVFWNWKPVQTSFNLFHYSFLQFRYWWLMVNVQFRILLRSFLIKFARAVPRASLPSGKSKRNTKRTWYLPRTIAHISDNEISSKSKEGLFVSAHESSTTTVYRVNVMK